MLTCPGHCCVACRGKLLPPASTSDTAAATPRVQLAFVPTLSASDIAELYGSYYAGERFVRTQKGVPSLGDVQGQHGGVVGGVQVHSGRERVVVVVGSDNLLKGAATQCIQNLNLVLGYDEYADIPLEGEAA